MKGTVLLIVAMIAKWLFHAFGYVWGLCSIIRRTKYNVWRTIDNYHHQIALSNDQNSNAVMQHFLNDTFARGELRPFGNPDKTISREIGILEYHDQLTKWGSFWERVLDRIDPGHVEKALMKDPYPGLNEIGPIQNQNVENT